MDAVVGLDAMARRIRDDGEAHRRHAAVRHRFGNRTQTGIAIAHAEDVAGMAMDIDRRDTADRLSRVRLTLLRDGLLVRRGNGGEAHQRRAAQHEAAADGGPSRGLGQACIVQLVTPGMRVVAAQAPRAGKPHQTGR